MTDHFPSLSAQSSKKEDSRGFLEVLYENGNVVLKRSFSKKGVFRGMHRQLQPNEQTKLIRVISGKILDFVVEFKEQKNEIHWREIDATSDWIKIESKFAHGFFALEDTVFEYICDGAYQESAEQSYSITEFLESTIRISNLVLSEKDSNAQKIVVDAVAVASPPPIQAN